MKHMHAYHTGSGPAFPTAPNAHGPAGGITAGPMGKQPMPASPAVAAPMPPSASVPSPSGGGGLQGLIADATQAAGGG